MQKSLEQIQQENRKFILEAIHDCSYDPRTLSTVLLALTHRDISQPKPELKFYNGYIITINGYAWNLDEITLEEQTEETQRGINKLFNN